MRNTVLTFGQRLAYLMKQKGIKTAAGLSRALYETGVIEYPDVVKIDHKRTETEQQRYTEKTIRDHLKDCEDIVENLHGVWILRYCDFFGCSADYLLGYIDHPSHTATDVHEYTGLSENALQILHEWKNSDDQRKLWPSVLSKMLEDPRFADVMENLCAAQYTFNLLTPSDFGGNVRMNDKQAEIIAFLWYISKGFSDIAEDVIQCQN